MVVHWLGKENQLDSWIIHSKSTLELMTFAGEEEHIQDVAYFQALEHV